MLIPAFKSRTVILSIILLGWIFLLFNAQWVFGAFAAEAERILIIYLLALVVSMVIFKVQLPEQEFTVDKLLYFSIFFGVFYFTTKQVLQPVLPTAVIASIDVKAAAGFGVLYGFVKTFIEEIIFRHALWLKFRGIVSSILFGLFHAGVAFSTVFPEFGMIGVLYVFATLSALGLIWAFIRERFGLLGAWGGHFGYNTVLI